VNGRLLCWLSNETLEMSGDEVHFSQLFLDEEQVQVVDIFGPCNGILCLAGTLMMENGGLIPDYEIVLWNPATRESKMLRPMDVPTSTFEANFGFGYDPKTNDYKVVRILSFDSHCQVVVYSLSTNSWRVIVSTPNPPYSIVLPRYPSYLNGVHHWLAEPGGKLPFLLSFDMSNEVFQVVLGPPSEGYFSSEVAVVNDSVALISRCSSDWECEEWLEIWVLNESGVERPWTKISTIPCPSYLNLIQLREDGSLVRSNDDGFFDLYDPRTQEWKPLQLNEAIFAQIVSYTESLVFLNGSKKQDNS
jgi:F-box interacting protein